MAYYVVWLDKQHAKVFALSEQGASSRAVESASHTSHRSHPRHDDGHGQKHRDEEAFLRQVASGVKDASELLIVGPGVAKMHLKSLIETEYKALARRIVGCESMDHPSDREVVAFAKRHFKMNHNFWDAAAN